MAVEPLPLPTVPSRAATKPSIAPSKAESTSTFESTFESTSVPLPSKAVKAEHISPYLCDEHDDVGDDNDDSFDRFLSAAVRGDDEDLHVRGNRFISDSLSSHPTPDGILKREPGAVQPSRAVALAPAPSRAVAPHGDMAPGPSVAVALHGDMAPGPSKAVALMAEGGVASQGDMAAGPERAVALHGDMVAEGVALHSDMAEEEVALHGDMAEEGVALVGDAKGVAVVGGDAATEAVPLGDLAGGCNIGFKNRKDELNHFGNRMRRKTTPEYVKTAWDALKQRRSDDPERQQFVSAIATNKDELFDTAFFMRLRQIIVEKSSGEAGE